MKIVYIAGKFTAETRLEVEENALAAEKLAARVAAKGAMPVVPHSLGRVMLGTVGSAKFWYEGTLALLQRCDAIALVPGWHDSDGSVRERAWALQHLPVFEAADVESEGFERWARGT